MVLPFDILIFSAHFLPGSIFGWMGVEGFFAERRGVPWVKKKQKHQGGWVFDVFFLGGGFIF